MPSIPNMAFIISDFTLISMALCGFEHVYVCACLCFRERVATDEMLCMQHRLRPYAMYFKATKWTQENQREHSLPTTTICALTMQVKNNSRRPVTTTSRNSSSNRSITNKNDWHLQLINFMNRIANHRIRENWAILLIIMIVMLLVAPSSQHPSISY